MSARAIVLGVLVAALALASAGPARAQSPANDGPITLRATFDVPSVYVLRGLVQERDPAFTGQSAIDITLRLSEGDGAIKRLAINGGWWSSYHTGTSGTGGPSQLSHYEEDVYAGLQLGLGGRLDVDAGYRARTSPNRMFGTINEAQVRVTRNDRFRPYAFFVAELGGDQADQGAAKGSYAEFGAAPRVPGLGRVSVTAPVRIGVSLADYYESLGEDHRFGFFAAGALLTYPIGTSRFGSLQLRGGIDVYALGDTAKTFNEGKGSKVVGFGGLALTY